MYCPYCARWMTYQPWSLSYVCPNGHTYSIVRPIS